MSYNVTETTLAEVTPPDTKVFQLKHRRIDGMFEYVFDMASNESVEYKTFQEAQENAIAWAEYYGHKISIVEVVGKWEED